MITKLESVDSINDRVERDKQRKEILWEKNRYWKMYRRLAKQAVIFHVNSVVGLEYDDTEMKFNLRLLNGQVYRHATREWVAKEYPEDVVLSAMSMSQGFIPIDTSEIMVLVATSDDPIVKLKYVEGGNGRLEVNQMQSNKRKHNNKQGSWRGIATKKDGSRYEIDLTSEWMAENFPPLMLKILREYCLKNHNYLLVPLGLSRSVAKQPDETKPMIYYTQKTSVFSCRWQMDCITWVRNIINYSHSWQRRWPQKLGQLLIYCIDPMNALRDIVSTNLGKLQPRKIKKMSFHDLKSNQSEYPKVIVLEGSRGGIQHAVTVVANYVFDCNEPNALDLTEESLDWCVGGWDNKEGEEDIKFQKVLYGWHFVEHEKSKQKLITGN